MTEERRQQPGKSERSRSSHGAAEMGFTNAELAEMMDQMVQVVLRDMTGLREPLDAECWASQLTATWRQSGLSFGSPDGGDVFVPAFIRALERRGTKNALAALRALSAVGDEADRKRARTAAARVAARGGRREPSWATTVGGGKPVAAKLMYDEVFDDGVTVFIEFATGATADASAPNERFTLAIYVDNNLGGLVKDVFLGGPLAEFDEIIRQSSASEEVPPLRELELAEARARVEAALEMLDHTIDPPVSEDVDILRALVDARITQLPDGGTAPDEEEPLSEKGQKQLFERFLSATEGKRWRGDEDAEDVIEAAIHFGADYNYGGPLRWSPTVVEIFMVDWLPRKVIREPPFFTRVTEVLPDWVRFANRTRGVESAAIAGAAAAVPEFHEDMLAAAQDPESWGPAKAFATAAQQAGVDITDFDAMQAFVDRYNEELQA